MRSTVEIRNDKRDRERGAVRADAADEGRPVARSPMSTEERGPGPDQVFQGSVCRSVVSPNPFRDKLMEFARVHLGYLRLEANEVHENPLL